jgi:hypothetical protein
MEYVIVEDSNLHQVATWERTPRVLNDDEIDQDMRDQATVVMVNSDSSAVGVYSNVVEMGHRHMIEGVQMLSTGATIILHKDMRVIHITFDTSDQTIIRSISCKSPDRIAIDINYDVSHPSIKITDHDVNVVYYSNNHIATTSAYDINTVIDFASLKILPNFRSIDKLPLESDNPAIKEFSKMLGSPCYRMYLDALIAVKNDRHRQSLSVFAFQSMSDARDDEIMQALLNRVSPEPTYPRQDRRNEDINYDPISAHQTNVVSQTGPTDFIAICQICNAAESKWARVPCGHMICCDQCHVEMVRQNSAWLTSCIYRCGNTTGRPAFLMKLYSGK